LRNFDRVIIGNSAAGIGAIEGLLSQGDSGKGSTCLVSEENHPAYSRPFIGHLVDGSRSIEELYYRPSEFYRRRGLVYMGGRLATHLDLEDGIVELDGGEMLGFRKLLIATGGSPIVPPIPGLGQNSYSFMKISDAEDLMKRLEGEGAKSAVILGGGLIGAAATAALLERGVETTIVELAPRILSSVLDEDASSLIQSELDARGVRTVTGHTISRVDGDRLGPISTLDSGEVIDSDLLVVAIGVQPRAELAMDAGIEVDRGIIVNRRMETSVPGVYAAGDCAQVYDSLREKSMVLALWPTAYMGGRVAGRNMAGGNAELEWSTSMNSMNYFGKSVLSAGIVNSPEGGGWDEIIENKEGSYRKIITRGGVLKGFVLVGDVEKAGLYLQMMRGKTDIDKLSKSPLDEDFGLIHLPTMERRRILKEAVRVAGH